MAEAKQLCTFYAGGGYFGIPVERVQEVVKPQPLTPVPLAPKVVRGLINLRGQILTAVDLGYRLGLRDLGDPTKLMNVVVRTDESPISFLVDEIGDVLDVDEHAFENPPETLQGEMRDLIEGAYKLEGRLLLSLNTARTLHFDELPKGARQ
ncbi:MAG TPA: chemotaxis protein CheW [Candidatus Acidoferrales bacterium]|nr:chemotaxis protein CheW [Candidatus Acidoferrales bacterium]